MITIRLSRVGKRKQPSYRMIVQDKLRDPWGKYFENVGEYNPRTKPKTIKLKVDRIKAWLDKGASCSPTVHNLLVDAKIITGEKMTATHHDKQIRKAEEAKPEEKKAEEAKA